MFLDPNLWVGAEKVRNFILDDPLLDWFDLYGLERGFERDSDSTNYLPETDYQLFIRRKGLEFESRVLRILEETITQYTGDTILKVASSRQDRMSARCRDETVALMTAGIAAIYQPVLWNEENHTFGSPDFLIRSDLLDQIFCQAIEDYDIRSPAPLIGAEDWHYVVVDMKYTTLHLNAQGELANSDSHDPCKAQLAIYNQALESAQGFAPLAAFVIGRGWYMKRKGVEERGTSCFDLLGKFSVIQPQHKKEPTDWLQKAESACEWIRQVRREGFGWDPLRDYVGIPQIRPNMKNAKDAPWHTAKRRIAEEVGELTGLWQVGLLKRNDAVSQGITDWRDPRVTAGLLGVGPSYAPKLQLMLDVNRATEATVLPARVTIEEEVWRTPKSIEFFVDFETCNDLDDDFSKLPEKGGSARIFMVGCGHVENGQWKFSCFTAERMTDQDEAEVLRSWFDHMQEVKQRLGPFVEKPIVFHWSPAEDSSFAKSYQAATKRLGGDWPEPNWFDFLGRVVKAEPVVVKGAFGFGIKAIGKALHKMGTLATDWSDGPADGLGAMVGSWWCYEQAAISGGSVFDVPLPEPNEARKLMKEVVDYNEVDCKVMMQCIDYLRNHH
jgi:hypothetical protein